MSQSCGVCGEGTLAREIQPMFISHGKHEVEVIKIEQYCEACGTLIMTPKLIELNAALRVAIINILEAVDE